MLKNKAIVDEAEKLLNDFKPVTYDVTAHVKAIETFEAKAVSVMISSGNACCEEGGWLLLGKVAGGRDGRRVSLSSEC